MPLEPTPCGICGKPTPYHAPKSHPTHPECREREQATLIAARERALEDAQRIIAQSLPPTGRHVAGKTLREQQWFFRAWLTQEFGEQLARMINKKRLSIHQVAVRADMPRKTIHAILEGDRIAFNEAADVALAFGCYLDISIKPIAGYRGAKKPKKKAR